MPSAAPSAPPPSTPRPVPTAIRGAAPERMAVEAAELRRLALAAEPAVLERARALVHGVVAGRASERRAALWGQGAQQEHDALVSQGLDLARSDALRRAAAHLDRMTALLGLIDLDAACGSSAPGVLGRLVRAGNARIDTPEELAAARGELDQVLGLLARLLPDLVALRGAIEEHWQRIEEAGREAVAAALAAEVLAARLREERPAVARIYLDRSLALGETAAQTQSGAGLREAQVERPLRLIAAIQDVAIAALPAWLGSLTALDAAAGRRQAPPAEVDQLARQLDHILQTLTP